MANGYYTVTLTQQQIQVRDALGACVPAAGMRTPPAGTIATAGRAWNAALPSGLSDNNTSAALAHKHTNTFNLGSHISESGTFLGPMPNVVVNRARTNIGQPGNLSRFNTTTSPHQLLDQWLSRPVCSSVAAAPASIAPAVLPAGGIPAGGLPTRTPAQICADTQCGNNAALQFLVMRNGAWRMGNQGGNATIAQFGESTIAGTVRQNVNLTDRTTQRFTDRASLESGYITQIEQDLQARSHLLLLEQNGGRLPATGQVMANGMTYNPARPAYLMLTSQQQSQVQQDQLQSQSMQDLLVQMDSSHLFSANPNFSVYPSNSANNGNNPLFPTTFRANEYNGVVTVGFVQAGSPAVNVNKAPPSPATVPPEIEGIDFLKPLVPRRDTGTGKGISGPTKAVPPPTKAVPEDGAMSSLPGGLPMDVATLALGEGRNLQSTITISGASPHDPAGQFNNGLSGGGVERTGGNSKFA